MTMPQINISELRNKLESSENLPSLPMIVQDILAVAEDPRSGVKDVEAVVEKDQSCSVKLLKLSNSAYYGFSRQITTIRQAILVIGLEGVKSAAMSLGMADAFCQGAKDNKQILTHLWVHSMAVATAAQILAKHSGQLQESRAYLSGLVHDFGKVVLAGHFDGPYMGIFTRAKDEKISIATLERSEFGVDHETVAGWVAEAWDLPDSIQEVVRSHHGGFKIDQANKEILLIGLADALAYRSGVGDGGNGAPKVLDEAFFAAIGLDLVVGDQVVAELRRQSDRFSALLNVSE